MKVRVFSLFLCLLGVLLGAGPRDADWKKVEEAGKKDQPKTQIELLSKIEKEALADEQWAEASRAMAMRLATEAKIEGNALVIQKLDEELKTAPQGVRPILRALAAGWMHRYYLQNQWRFARRSSLGEPVGDDLETWDLARILSEIDARMQLALADEEVLKKTPVAGMEELLSEGDLGDEWRPAMFDFVAHRALEFYSLEMVAVSRPMEAFSFGADTPAFGTVDEFLAWKPESDDRESPKFRALEIYRKLLQFHREDDDRAAFHLANLERLRWAAMAADEEGRDDRFEAALRRFIKESNDHPVSAWARVDLGDLLIGEQKNKEAHGIYQEGAKGFPGHPFGKLCRNGVISLERKNLQVSTESHWTPAGEGIHLQHKNLKRVWFRVYSLAFKPGQNLLQGDPLPEAKKWLPALLKGTPVKAWSQELFNKGEYKVRHLSIPAPLDLPDGYHVLVASGAEDFSLEDNAVSVSGVHITALALLADRARDGRLEGFVVDAVTGAPLNEIDIEAWVRTGKSTTKQATKTNASGFFRFEKSNSGRHLVVASRGRQRAVARVWAGGDSSYVEKDRSGVVFFTDRAIYRPGQTVHFKGIWYLRNQSKGKYELLKKKGGTVVLRDPNRKEVAKMEIVTNERGAFSGSFTVPDGSVLGRCNIRLGNVGGTSFRVEEYKRPKFFSEVDNPDEEVVLGKKVKVKVRAEAYTGAPVDGAKVSWRVTRNARLPSWTRWCWWAPPVNSTSEEIARGISTTDADGSVVVEFVAKPDGSLAKEFEPIFDYLVTADVTGGAGETRSASRRVSVGYTSLRASLGAEDWLEAGKDLEFRVTTESLGGEGRKAKGLLKIHRLKEPESCPRPVSNGGGRIGNQQEEQADPDRWEPGEVVSEFPVETDEKGKAMVKVSLQAGAYRLVFESEDAGGNEIKALLGIQVVEPDGADFPTMVPFYTTLPARSVQPGMIAEVFWGSGHEKARACIEWYQQGTLLKREWSKPGRTQQVFSHPIEESNRGGVTAVIHQVTMNRLHQFSRVIRVPWTNKSLTLRWEHLVSKLEPGVKESWTAVVEGAEGEAAVAEMVATMYDASLDTYARHDFPTLAGIFRSEWSSNRRFQFGSGLRSFENRSRFESEGVFRMGEMFRGFRDGLALYDSTVFYGRGYGMGGGWQNRGNRDAVIMNGAMFGTKMAPSAPAAPLSEASDATLTAGNRKGDGGVESDVVGDALGQGSGGDPGLVTARKNLQETAFFYPQLTSDKDGKVRISFTMPEALTTWRFLGVAHDGDLRSGLLEGETVTSKDLMVQPNPPRFLREGDLLEFTVKVTNQSDQEQSGTARLTLADAATDEDRTAALGVKVPSQEFTVPAKESRTLKWKLSVPDGAGFLKYKAVATTDNLSDGEEAWLPVLSRRILVTESMSLPIRNAGQKNFEFTKLLESSASETLEDRFLHVQVVSQPAWYAVMALPYLMEYPHECSEQTFNRYYANALARKIAGSDPKIRGVFDQWKAGGEALDSPLMKNADLKGIMLEETPWLREANDEAAARRRVGLLFDDNHMDRELERALRKLKQMQRGDGLWSWFPGGRGNEYISLYITTGFARLRELGVETDITPALKALQPLDAALTRRYEHLRKHKLLDGKNLAPWVAHHLYTRTFFMKDKKLSQRDRVAFDYFTGQARKHWVELGTRMSRAHLGLALHRLGDSDIPKLVTRSLKENARVTEEQGMFWKDGEGEGWHWWQAPVETQVMMIEAFREIDGDDAAVEDCQVWMIKQKQVGDWKTTKATADAVYALLRGGNNLLGSGDLLKISLGGTEVKPEKVEAGTGFYESRIVGEAVKPELGKIELVKSDEGVSWASVHWQYLEDMAKVTRADGKQLQLEKKLFVRKNTDKGPVLMPLEGAVQVGDEIVTRVVLRNDRAMEFVHLKDLRGSGTEPMNVLSGYRWQDGFGYYEVTRDAASHFFIDRLPPGVHVFETSVRVQHAGEYQSGIAQVRCMYAPEFSAHSASVGIRAE